VQRAKSLFPSPPAGLASALAVVGAMLALGCGAAPAGARVAEERAPREAPADPRPGYCSADLPFWWPLTGAEAAALKGAGRARKGDPEALLSLAIFASGNRRDAADYARYQERVRRFVAEVRPGIERARDAWHRGDELHRAMHRAFFPHEKEELGGYRLDQGRLTGIFDDGHYNCMSSTLLYLVLAREFDLKVQGALMPAHAFVELDAGGKLVAVETTSSTGFDQVHDARFYRVQAAGWSSKLGPRPATLEDYEKRTVMAPYLLVAKSMLDEHTVAKLDPVDVHRLREAKGFVAPDDEEALRGRLIDYNNEAIELREQKAEPTVVRMFECVWPAVSAARPRDAATAQTVGWLRYAYASALHAVGRDGDSMRVVEDAVVAIDDAWEDAPALRRNLAWLVSERIEQPLSNEQIAEALQIAGQLGDACKADGDCSQNVFAGVMNSSRDLFRQKKWAADLERLASAAPWATNEKRQEDLRENQKAVFQSWAIEHQNAGDWPGARKVLEDCEAKVPGLCRDDLQGLESRHRF
jgi:hypothetical protein